MARNEAFDVNANDRIFTVERSWKLASTTHEQVAVLKESRRFCRQLTPKRRQRRRRTRHKRRRAGRRTGASGCCWRFSRNRDLLRPGARLATIFAPIGGLARGGGDDHGARTINLIAARCQLERGDRYSETMARRCDRRAADLEPRARAWRDDDSGVSRRAQLINKSRIRGKRKLAALEGLWGRRRAARRNYHLTSS